MKNSSDAGPFYQINEPADDLSYLYRVLVLDQN